MTSKKPQVNFRVDESVKTKLADMATPMGISKSELAKLAFEKGLALIIGASIGDNPQEYIASQPSLEPEVSGYPSITLDDLLARLGHKKAKAVVHNRRILTEASPAKLPKLTTDQQGVYWMPIDPAREYWASTV